MPGLDKTGPMGQGSQTGRQQGNCSNKNTEIAETPIRGRGMGRGFRNRKNVKPEIGAEFRGGKGRGLGRGQQRRGRNF